MINLSTGNQNGLNDHIGYLLRKRPSKIKLAVLNKLGNFTNLLPELVSYKELEVCFYIDKLMSNKEIAEAIFVTEKTVKFHKTNIYKRLKVKSEKKLLKLLIDRKLTQCGKV